jgi:hypothetical protein
MIQVKAIKIMELGKTYKFVLESGQTRTVVIRGSRSSDSGAILEIEVDGVAGEYGSLDKAIGPYLSSSAA